MVHLPGPLVAVLGEMVAKLRASGEHAICDQLSAVLTADLPSPVTPETQPKPRRVRSPEAKERDRLRKLAERSSATRPPVGQVADIGGQSGGHLADVQKVSQTLPKEEEKRKPSDSGKICGESESSSPIERSELRARADGVRQEIRQSDMADKVADTVADRRVGLRALRLIQDTLAREYDYGTWRTQLETIATKPEADLKRVLANVKQDAWARENRGLVNPGHILRRWDAYLDPPKPKASKRGFVNAPTYDEFDDSGTSPELMVNNG